MYSHKNALKTYHYSLFHPRGVLDETGCSGKFLRHFYDYTFCSVYMTLSTLLYFANQNYIVYMYMYVCMCVYVCMYALRTYFLIYRENRERTPYVSFYRESL